MSRWPRSIFESHPALARVLPFAVWVVLTALQGRFGAESAYWIYAAKAVVCAILVWAVWPLLSEWKFDASFNAAAVGFISFGVWVGLEGVYPKLGTSPGWSPPNQFGAGSALALFFVGVRLAASVLIVPIIEEVFFRSFLYRFLADKNFLEIPLNRMLPGPWLVTSVLFGLEHHEWLPGIITGFLLQGLVIRSGGIGAAVTAHALANLFLGLHVVWKGAWHFW